MTPLLVVLPYCVKDVALAEELIEFISDIHTPRAGGILLAADDQVPRKTVEDIQAKAKDTFSFARTMFITVTAGGWAPNKMFLSVAHQIKEQYRWPFFWMEPDCVPLKSDWLEQLENWYAECPKQFMGALISQDKNPKLPQKHLTGCSIYPTNAYDLYLDLPGVQNGSQAWDIGSAEAVVPKTMNTPLIQHFWGLPDLAPVFVSSRTKESPKNHLLLDFLRKDAVIFHRDKTHSLIPLIGERLGVKPMAPQPPETEMEPAVPATIET